MTRKIQEAYITLILEKELEKEDIITTYLNTIYFGYGSYGVQAASQAYFSKDVQDLTLAPVSYTHLTHPEKDKTAHRYREYSGQASELFSLSYFPGHLS